MVNGSTLEQKNTFEYLGSIITSDGKCDTEIKRRIGIAKTGFSKMSNVFLSHNIRVTTKKPAF